jgi:hypothetical protein
MRLLNLTQTEPLYVRLSRASIRPESTDASEFTDWWLSEHLRIVSQFRRHYTAQHPRRQPSSYSLLWKPENPTNKDLCLFTLFCSFIFSNIISLLPPPCIPPKLSYFSSLCLLFLLLSFLCHILLFPLFSILSSYFCPYTRSYVLGHIDDFWIVTTCEVITFQTKMPPSSSVIMPILTFTTNSLFLMQFCMGVDIGLSC